MKKNIAVVLSGCGYLDGSEIHEAVLTLLALDRSGATYQCFAPDAPQADTINHAKKQPEGPARNMMAEAGRIARSNVRPMEALKVAEFDGIIFPGGYGAAKNLCSFATEGTEMRLRPDVERVAREFAQAGKPAGYICIAPAMIPRIYGAGVRCTIGNDTGTAQALQAMGAVHVNCAVDDVVIDETNRVISTPAYMLATRISEAAAGIDRLVTRLLEM